MKKILISLIAAMTIFGMVLPAMAEGSRGGGGHGGGSSRGSNFHGGNGGFGQRGGSGWRGGGGWQYGWHGGRYGSWWVADGLWSLYPAYYAYGYPFYNPYAYSYPYPAPYAAGYPAPVQQQPVNVEQAPPAQASAPMWYFCSGSNAYYPYVSECPSGWKSVPAIPPSAPARTGKPGSPALY